MSSLSTSSAKRPESQGVLVRIYKDAYHTGDCIDIWMPEADATKLVNSYPVVGQYPPTLAEFWAAVDKRGDDECWPSALSPFLYEDRWWSKHRLAYRLSHPELTKLPRLHHLGPSMSPGCCNPAHYVPYEMGKHNRPAPLRADK